jgi:hypothetical protein
MPSTPGRKRRNLPKTRNAARWPTRVAKRKPLLLSGGDPQIPQADGDAPVRAYIAAMAGWKRNVGRRLDELIVRRVRALPRADDPLDEAQMTTWIRQAAALPGWVP